MSNEGMLDFIAGDSKVTRREFGIFSLAALSGLSLAHTPSVIAGTPGAAPKEPASFSSFIIPPIYCLAYNNPASPGQYGQDRIVARYPLGIFSQDNDVNFRRWRDSIRGLNPDIIMLGYQDVIQEPEIPGPGHDLLRTVHDFCIYPNGYVPTVPGPYPGARNRIYDPGSPRWQDAFIAACKATLKSYPYDGLFLDQCTVFQVSHPIQEIRKEMLDALQATLLRLRSEMPDIYIIGNSSDKFAGLNGEMNEGRLPDLKAESVTFPGHKRPEMNMYLSLLTTPDDTETVRREMALAHSYGTYYGACVTGSKPLWFNAFDEVIAKFNDSKKG